MTGWGMRSPQSSTARIQSGAQAGHLIERMELTTSTPT